MSPRKADSITIAELRVIMRKFNIPGAYDVNAENKAFYVDLVTKEIEKQGITCETDKKTVVTIIKRLDTKCGSKRIGVIDVMMITNWVDTRRHIKIIFYSASDFEARIRALMNIYRPLNRSSLHSDPLVSTTDLEVYGE